MRGRRARLGHVARNHERWKPDGAGREGINPFRHRGPVPVADLVDRAATGEEPLLQRLALPRRLQERSGRRVVVAFGELLEAPRSPSGYQLVDPLLALWVRAGRYQ